MKQPKASSSAIPASPQRLHWRTNQETSLLFQLNTQFIQPFNNQHSKIITVKANTDFALPLPAPQKGYFENFYIPSICFNLGQQLTS